MLLAEARSSGFSFCENFIRSRRNTKYTFFYLLTSVGLYTNIMYVVVHINQNNIVQIFVFFFGVPLKNYSLLQIVNFHMSPQFFLIT